MAIMKETLPLDRILDQLTDLYEQILSNQDKKIITSPETVEALHRLSREIDEISQQTDIEIARAGISPEMIRKTILGPKTQLPVNIQNLLDRSQRLKGQLEGCRNILKDAMKLQKESQAIGGSRATEKRRDKFKKLGSKKGWIPL